VLQLEEFLSEDQEQVDYQDTTKFALVTDQQTDDAEIVLVNHTKLTKDIEGASDWFVAYIHLVKHPSCQAAWMVASVIRNPSYKGAGYVLYALASKIVNSPITSDRDSKTTNAAQQLWRRIEASSEWEETKLNNYASLGVNKAYFDVRKFPTKTMRRTSAPANTFYDCPLPNDYGDIKNPMKMLDVLGVAGAWKYIGSLDSTALSRQGNKLTKGNTLKHRLMAAGLAAFQKNSRLNSQNPKSNKHGKPPARCMTNKVVVFC
jgi:hypothetical protein